MLHKISLAVEWMHWLHVLAYVCAGFPHLEHQQKQEVGISNPLELLKQVKR